MTGKIILVGGGGHCKSCIDVIEQQGKYQIAGIVDLPEKMQQKILGYEIIATDAELPQLVKEYDNFLIAMGQIKNPDRRISLYKILKDLGATLPVIISPFAYVSKHAEIGAGTIVMHHALINAGAKIGNNCIINSKALVEHDAIIGDHCHIATGAIVNGGVKILTKTFLGSNAMARESIIIGEQTVIGGGVKVLRDLPDGSILK